jgi:TetR/AcrR family transcriptional repressor of lmrAB and yxaGH operons
VASGLDAQRAARLASLIVSAYEGGLIQSRVAGSGRPLQDTTAMLLDTLEGFLPKRRS